MRVESLRDSHVWWRIAERSWNDPLDPTYAAHRGGRWNPPRSFETLYFNEDVVTARINLRLFVSRWPYEPEDLRDDTGPVLVGAVLPRHQRVADAHSRAGLRALKLPPSYPLGADGKLVPHAICQKIGRLVKNRELRGLRARGARASDGAGRELAWFPATSRSRARRRTTLPFERWFWG